jgi:hypothetical protein
MVALPEGVRWAKATDEVIGPIARPFVTYCGRYETGYEGDQLVLSTDVDIALDVWYMERIQKRSVTFEYGDDGKELMVLTPPTIPVSCLNKIWGGNDLLIRLVWVVKLMIYDKRILLAERK